jgi:hypothetical protein
MLTLHPRTSGFIAVYKLEDSIARCGRTCGDQPQPHYQAAPQHDPATHTSNADMLDFQSEDRQGPQKCEALS